MGVEQLVLFVITIIAVLATDLLTGVGVGIACKLAIHLFNAPIGLNLFVVNATTTESEDSTTIALRRAAIFLNYISLLHESEKDFKKAGRVFRVVGLESYKPMSSHPLAARKLAKAG